MTNFGIKGTELEVQEAAFFFQGLRLNLMGMASFGQVENDRWGEDPIWKSDREVLRSLYRDLRASGTNPSVESYRKARKTFAKAAGFMSRRAKLSGTKVSVFAARGYDSSVDPRVCTELCFCFH
jgi:hypothetical protein